MTAARNAKAPPAAQGSVLDELLLEEDLAGRLGITRERLGEWRRADNGPAFIKKGKQFYYRRSVVDAWLLSDEHRPTSPEVTS